MKKYFKKTHILVGPTYFYKKSIQTLQTLDLYIITR